MLEVSYHLLTLFLIRRGELNNGVVQRDAGSQAEHPAREVNGKTNNLSHGTADSPNCEDP